MATAIQEVPLKTINGKDATLGDTDRGVFSGFDGSVLDAYPSCQPVGPFASNQFGNKPYWTGVAHKTNRGEPHELSPSHQ